MKLPFIKRNGGLFPCGKDSQEALDRVAEGREIVLELKRARNVRQHRLFFALLGVLVDNGDVFDSREAALTAVKIAIGQVDTYIEADTLQTFYIPRSIAFESCSQDDFAVIFEDALRVICQRWLGDADCEEIRAEVFRMVDGDAASTLGQRAA